MSEFINKAKGKLKHIVGALTGNHALEREGEKDERKGQLEGAAGDVKHAVKGAVKDAKHAVAEVTK